MPEHGNDKYQPERDSLIRLFLYVYFLLSSLFIIHFCYAGSEQYSVIKTEYAVIRFNPELKGAADNVAEIYNRLTSELENTLKWRSDFIPEILLIKENKLFQQITGNAFFVAFAIPEKYLIVIDYSKMNLHPFSLSVTLKHELCHLLLHHHIRKENLPKWLDEGICQWISDGISEIIIDKQSVLNEAVISENLIPLNALSRSFPGDKHYLMLAYEESKSVTDYIVKEFGRESLLSFLNDLKNEVNLSEAVQHNFSISFEGLEEKWHFYLKNRITWFVYFSIHIYEILFFFSALITIYGFIRLVIKKREYQDQEDDDNPS